MELEIFNDSTVKTLKDQQLLKYLLNEPNEEKITCILDTFETLGGMIFAKKERITIVSKIDDKVIKKIYCIREILHRIIHEELRNKTTIKSINDVLKYCKTVMASLPNEQLQVFFLNTRNVLIYASTEAYGTINTVTIHDREIIKKALILEASAIILVHNHPSGISEPSCHDITQTKKLVESCSKLGIMVLDHIIIGINNYFSMKEHSVI